MSNIKPIPVAASLLSLAITQVNAETSAALLVGSKMVIQATRIEQPLEDVSRSISVIEKEEIDTIQPQSVAEILAFEPNILIEGGSRPGYQTINIRGLGDERIVQTVDGVRQDFESGHRASYFLDPILLKSVEVIKGPASTLWGSGALGGVVSQNTVEPSDILEADQDVGGLIKTGWNFNNDQTSTTALIAGQRNNIDWLFSGYYRDSNDIETGNNTLVEDSASRDQGFLGKINWQLDEQQSLALNFRHADVSGGVPSNGSSNVNGTSVFLIDKDQVNNNISADYRIKTTSPLVNAQVLAYWNGVEVDENRVSDGRFDSTEKDTYGINANNQSKLGNSTLIYGIDGYHSDFEAKRSGTNRPAPPKAEIDVWGAFAQLTFPLQESLKVELGGRYDYFGVDAKNLNESRSDNQFSPSAAVIWQTNDALELTLRHDRAFRAPEAEELYSTGTHFCMFPGFCNTFQSNPDLKPEKAANTELIATLNLSNNFQVKGSIFKNKVDDFIEQTVTPPTFFPVMDAGNTFWSNVDEAELKGFEIETLYEKDNFKFKFGYGQTRGKDRKSGDPLNNIPADTWTAGASYTVLNKQLTTGVRVIHAEEQNRSTTATYDNYTVTDIYASWEPASIEALKVDFTINNITDEHYRRAWSQLDEAGREIVISAAYKF
ncbi:TonB-dependent hemoglobin/transferrin/lactoferrin family receptor [Neptuniibacter sp.]|uniref:TonB-dependent hemoglobin/transferrin/lactoferrin family receptor n=1 Tax=Neptuniibacter sp. TaxID=1962643 RepID=UPI0026356570|nr:TonB-dependent hemoglobin/transferrin/lactoferrin family receptor [Neptuniibacter sp.]MCP4594873.1 TonB-dependent hemoglobin/transferrin/lactoferrin family receptor [Neptuniibacter sp.]